jgi:APA family basic amino acid/polyamine antiporter
VFSIIAAFVPLNVLAELINVGTLTAFTLVSIAVMVLRRTRPNLPRAFRCPGGNVVPVLSVAFCIFLMAHLQAVTWIAFLCWMALGLAIYFIYARRNAVLHNHGG